MNYGSRHTDATREKMREAWKRRRSLQALKELTRLTEEMGLYPWQVQNSGNTR